MLVSRPTATGYGSAVAEILNAFHIGRHLNARVCFVKPARPLNHAIFELESGDVPMLRGWRAGLTRSRWRVTHGLLEAADRMRLTIVRRAT